MREQFQGIGTGAAPREGAGQPQGRRREQRGGGDREVKLGSPGAGSVPGSGNMEAGTAGGAAGKGSRGQPGPEPARLPRRSTAPPSVSGFNGWAGRVAPSPRAAKRDGKQRASARETFPESAPGLREPRTCRRQERAGLAGEGLVRLRRSPWQGHTPRGSRSRLSRSPRGHLVSGPLTWAWRAPCLSGLV